MVELRREFEDRRLLDKVAVITGAGRGIGRCTAETFARAGAKVLVATRSAGPGQQAVDAITSAGGKAALHVVDLTSRAAARGALQAAVDTFGGLDIVLHNAASTPSCPIGDMDDDTLDDVLTVNFKTAYWLTAEALPLLARSAAPVILAVSSVTGNCQWQKGYSAYGASKAALNAFVRMAAVELGARGIRVNGVEPGMTMTETVVANFPAAEVEKIRAVLPLGETARPIDIANALLYLASDEASRITGQIVTVDGGQHLAHP